MASQASQGGESLLKLRRPDGLPVTTTRIDFSKSPLADHYSPYFAMVIDNLLTPDECAALLTSAGSGWKTLNKGESWRECEQILSISPEWANALSQRLAQHLPEEAKSLRKGNMLSGHIAGLQNLKASQGASKTVWKLRGADERLSFLRYRPGNHFKPHCDALYSPRGGEKSFLTCQIYLSDMPEDKDGDGSGGETRFWPSHVGMGRKKKSEDREDETGQQAKEESFLDVKPKMGRALVFQQRMLWHSGQEVKHGEKFTVRLDLMYEHYFEKPSR